MAPQSDQCEFHGEHPALAVRIENLERRVEVIERAEENRGKMRKGDIDEMRSKIEAVNEKLTALAVQLAGINGKLLAAAFFMSGAGALVMFLLTRAVGR